MIKIKIWPTCRGSNSAIDPKPILSTFYYISIYIAIIIIYLLLYSKAGNAID